MKQTFKTAYGKRERVTYETTGPSLTQQHFKDEVDIKNVIRKYDRTGLISNVRKAVGEYGDYSTAINEYADALNLVINAQNNFAALPAEIREAYQNDPGQMLESVTNKDDKAYDLGLLQRPVSQVEAVVNLEANKSAAEPPAADKGQE